MAGSRKTPAKTARTKHGKSKIKASKTRKLPRTSWICELPDEILVSVLSFLPLKEAGMTSILSKRWRHVWEYIPTLNFDASKLLDQRFADEDCILAQVPRYVHWVDQVVSSHKAPTLDEFRVRFDLRNGGDGKTKNSIDTWIRFSMEKRVKKLTLDLSAWDGNRYLSLCYTYPSLPLFSNNLTSLVFCGVDIVGEVIESFLCNCPALEYLSVSISDTLVGLKVAGPSLNLKYLSIENNAYLERLEISAPNLISCSFAGRKIRVQYSLPKVVEISLDMCYATDLKSSFSDLGCHLSQIEVLKLRMMVDFKYITMPIEYPVFERLKKLDLILLPDVKDDLFQFMPLIQACPFLHHLKLQLYWSGPRRQVMRTREPCSHPYNMNMKIVEIVGFLGVALDVEFVLYLMESVVSLDTVIIDTNIVGYPVCSSEFLNPRLRRKARRRARKRAKRVFAHIKPGTKLVIC